MKHKTTLIKLSQATTRVNESYGNAGEAAELCGLRSADNVLSPVGLLRAEAALPAGHSLLLLDDDTIILKRGRTVSILNLDGTTSVVAELNSPALKARKVGDYYVVTSEQGCAVFTRNDNSNLTRLHQATLLPEINFEQTEVTEVTTPMAGVRFDTPYSAWQSLLPGDERRLVAAATDAWKALRKRAERAQLFTSPVALRYVLRLDDGSAVYASAPTVLGTLTPPTAIADVDSGLTQTATGSLRANAFAARAAISAGVGAAWARVVSSIDIEIAQLSDTYSTTDASLRCLTTANTHQLQATIATLTAAAVARRLESAEWRVAARINDVTGTAQLTVYADSGYRAAAAVPTGMSPIFTKIPDCIECFAGHLALGGGRRRVLNNWHLNFLQSEAVPANYYITATTSRGGERQSIVATFRATRSSLRLPPMIAVPIGHAIALEIGMLRQGTAYRFSCDLTPTADGTMSYYVNDGLAPIVLTASSEPYAVPVGHTVVEETPNRLWMSLLSNPLAVEWEKAIADSRINGLATAVKQVAANIFGRYPIYAFSDNGIYAVSTERRGAEPRLLSPLRVASQERLAMLGDMVLFVADAALYLLRNGRIEQINADFDAMNMRAVERNREVWCVTADGSTRVVAPDGSYFTSREAIAEMAEGGAVVQGGKITAFGEVFPSPVAVSYLSHPFNVEGELRWIQWDCCGDGINLTFTLRAADTDARRGPIINTITAEGYLDRPLRVPLRVPPIYRKFRLEITGTMPDGTLLLPVKIGHRINDDDGYPRL